MYNQALCLSKLHELKLIFGNIMGGCGHTVCSNFFFFLSKDVSQCHNAAMGSPKVTGISVTQLKMSLSSLLSCYNLLVQSRKSTLPHSHSPDAVTNDHAPPQGPLACALKSYKLHYDTPVRVQFWAFKAQIFTLWSGLRHHIYYFILYISQTKWK